MSDKVEGTFVLDGLLEGVTPEHANAEDRLREWAATAAFLKLPFSIEFDANRFSILADDNPIPLSRLGPNPADTVTGLIDELLELFPDDDRRHLLSTIRSVEYGKGVAVQTLYAVGPDGKTQTRARTVEAATEAASPRLSRKGLALMVGLGKTSGKTKVGIINSIGERRQRAAVRKLAALTAQEDSQIACAAAADFCNIAYCVEGDP